MFLTCKLIGKPWTVAVDLVTLPMAICFAIGAALYFSIGFGQDTQIDGAGAILAKSLLFVATYLFAMYILDRSRFDDLKSYFLKHRLSSKNS
jgi:hypothetical protein